MRRRVHMRYQSRGRQAMTVRDGSPQRPVHYRSTSYLYAWCHERERLQLFAFDTVEAADVMDNSAKDVPIKTVEAELDGGYGNFAGSKPQWATLVFSSSAAQWVSREEWHPSQTTSWLAYGRLEVKLPYTNQAELSMDMLRHAGQVAVKEPQTLAAAFTEQLRLALIVSGLSC